MAMQSQMDDALGQMAKVFPAIFSLLDVSCHPRSLEEQPLMLGCRETILYQRTCSKRMGPLVSLPASGQTQSLTLSPKYWRFCRSCFDRCSILSLRYTLPMVNHCRSDKDLPIYS